MIRGLFRFIYNVLRMFVRLLDLVVRGVFYALLIFGIGVLVAFFFHPEPDVPAGSALMLRPVGTIVEQAELAGVTADTELRQCVKDQRFADFISGNTKKATETGLWGLAEGARLLDASGQNLQPEGEPQRLISTPTVIVNGEQWSSGRDGDLEAYILKVKAALEGNGADTAPAAGADTPAETE